MDMRVRVEVIILCINDHDLNSNTPPNLKLLCGNLGLNCIGERERTSSKQHGPGPASQHFVRRGSALQMSDSRVGDRGCSLLQVYTFHGVSGGGSPIYEDFHMKRLLKLL